MSFDDQIRVALESLREQLDAQLRAFSQQAVRMAAEERQLAVRAATDAASAEARLQAEGIVAEIRSHAEAQIVALHKSLEELRAHAQQQLENSQRTAQVEIERAHAEMESFRAEIQSIRTEAEGARLAADARAQETNEAVEQAHADAHHAELSRANRLAEAIRTLDAARGISEVLDRLVQCAGHEVDRAAMLMVKGKRLTGWRLAGFEADAPSAASIDLSLDEAELAGAVLQTGVPASRFGDEGDGPALPPFAGDPIGRRAMALPVLVGGEIVAVLYADARCAGAESEQRWPAALEVLVRHASRVLEAITVLEAAGLSLREPMARASHKAIPAGVEHA